MQFIITKDNEHEIGRPTVSPGTRRRRIPTRRFVYHIEDAEPAARSGEQGLREVPPTLVDDLRLWDGRVTLLLRRARRSLGG